MKPKKKKTIRERLAAQGFLFNGQGFEHTKNRKAIKEYIDSGAYKVPKRSKRLKLEIL